MELNPKAIRALGDEALIGALGDAIRLPVAEPTVWEADFVAALPGVFVKFGGLTWKQRRVARRLLERWVARMNRGQRMRAQKEAREDG